MAVSVCATSRTLLLLFSSSFVCRCFGQWHLCLYGPRGWHDVKDVEVNVKSKSGRRNIGSGFWKANPERKDYFGYLIPVDASDEVSVKVVKDSGASDAVWTVGGQESEETSRIWSWNSSAAVQVELVSFMSQVRHSDMWKDFLTSLHRNGAQDSASAIVSRMDGVWKDVRRKHKGHEIMIFMDGFGRGQEEEIIEFNYGDLKTTKKKIQLNGAVWCAWSLPKEVEMLSFTAPGVGSRKDLFKIKDTGFYHQAVSMRDGTVNVFVMVYSSLRRVEETWKSIRSVMRSTGNETPYWHRQQSAWVSERLEDIYKAHRNNPDYAADGTYESETSEQAATKFYVGLILLCVCIAVVIAFICLAFRQDEDSDSEVRVKNVGSDDSSDEEQQAQPNVHGGKHWPVESVGSLHRHSSVKDMISDLSNLSGSSAKDGDVFGFSRTKEGTTTNQDAVEMAAGRRSERRNTTPPADWFMDT